MKRSVLARIGAVLLLGVLSAAAPSVAAGEAKRIALVTPYMANATTAYAIKQFQLYAGQEGWQVTVSDTAGDFGLLVSRIEDAVTQKYDAIVLGMGDPAQMTQGLKSAQAAGIPVFGLDAGTGEGVLLNVTSDNAALGMRSAQILAKAIGGKGKVVMFTHEPHPGVRARAAGAAAEFAKYPGITVIQKIHIGVPGPVDNARKITEDLLTANPAKGSIDGIWAGWDEPAYGAVQAINRAGRGEIKVVGIDGTDFAKSEIAKKGPFISTIQQDFDGMAKLLTGLVKDAFAGKKPGQDLYKIPGKVFP